MKINEKANVIFDKYHSGTFTTKDVCALGFTRDILSKMIEKGIIEKVDRGIYVRSGILIDNEYIIQCKYKGVILSKYTSLYLLGYLSEQPSKIYISIKQGYNCKNLKKENVDITNVMVSNYDLGKISVFSYYGNECVIYNIERTICDFIKGREFDKKVFANVLLNYIKSKQFDYEKLKEYAIKLRVWKKLEKYLMILM